jgi:hypothetical protein
VPLAGDWLAHWQAVQMQDAQQQWLHLSVSGPTHDLSLMHWLVALQWMNQAAGQELVQIL